MEKLKTKRGGWKLNLTEAQRLRRKEIGMARRGKYSDETRKKMSEARMGMKFTPEHKENLKTARNTRPPATEETRRKMGEAHRGRKLTERHKQALRDWHIAHPNLIRQDTSIELAIQDELADRQIIFIKQFVFEGIARVDFFLPEHNVVIQCDGCYWHNCPEHYPGHHKEQRQKDITKDAKLTFRGLKVYRFWEHDIKRSAGECLDIISELTNMHYEV